MSGTITFLVDNRAEEPFKSEHAFSILLETRGKRLLFDTGLDEALFLNAQQLGISLAGLDFLVLSHGHYDHGGNLAKIFALNPSIQFYAHPECMTERWSLQPSKSPRSSALTAENLAAIENLSSSQINWCDKPVEIIPGIRLTGPIPRKSSFEDVGGPFYLDRDGNTPDLLPDDLALWVDENSGLTVICGCCHSGVKNTVDHIASLTDQAPINTLLGGFHLIHALSDRLKNTVDFLNETGLKRVIPAHCTGEAGMELLQKQLKAEVQLGTVGLQIKI